MKLEDLGYNKQFENYRINNHLTDFQIGRVVAEHKERYTIKTAAGDLEAEITGNMRFSANSREDFPATGDWVALTIYDPDFAIIHHILPRFSIIKRQAVGQFGEIQIIAANIDVAFIVQSIDRDFNINRLERYLTVCNDSKISPIIVLSKTDLIGEHRISELLETIKIRIKDVPIIPISNVSTDGYDKLKAVIKRGKTYCLLGSSGVGKSTLTNNLSDKAVMRTDTISPSTNKGKHVTSHRELIILESGGILVDNPGMREVGIADSEEGLDKTFNDIVNLSQNCKFKDCTHTKETGCSVLKAIETGELDNAAYQNYLKMEKEKAHFESTLEEKRKKDKEFGKMLKNYHKSMNKNKF